MTPPGHRLRRLASRVCSDETLRRLVDPVIADLQFEYVDAHAGGHRWRARLATLRAALALTRVAVHRALPLVNDALTADDRAGWRIGRAALAATILVVMAVWSLPLIALVTGAYPSMPVTAANVSRLLVYVVPEAWPVATPIGLAIGVLTVCGNRSMARRARAAVALLAAAGTAVAFVLFIWIAPRASQAFRDLAEPRGIESRINPPGSRGDQFQRIERWTILSGTAVLAAFAVSAAGAARGRPAIRFAAGIAAAAYPFVYLPAGVAALTRVLPVALAAWLPNILYTAVTILLIRLNRPRRREVRAAT
jgi:hypothetical protein